MNKTPKTFIYLVSLIFTLFAATSMAQQAGKGGHGQTVGSQQGANQLRLFYELGLDEDQAAEVQAIMEAARLMHTEEWANFQSNNEAIRAETHGAIMAVLDEVQQQRYLELQALRAERWAESGRGRGGKNGANGGSRGGAGECPNPDCPNADCPNTDMPDGDG